MENNQERETNVYDVVAKASRVIGRPRVTMGEVMSVLNPMYRRAMKEDPSITMPSDDEITEAVRDFNAVPVSRITGC